MKTPVYAAIVTIIALGSLSGNALWVKSLYKTHQALESCKIQADRARCQVAVVPVITRHEEVRVVQAELLPPPVLN